MKKSVLPVVLLVVSVFAVSYLSPSGAFAQPRGPRAGNSGNTNESYMVIKVTDDNKVENKVEYRAISSSQYKDEEKRVKEDNAQKLKEWKDEIKNDPTAPRPKKILIKKIKTGYATQKVAQEYADKLRDEELNKDDQKPKDNKR